MANFYVSRAIFAHAQVFGGGSPQALAAILKSPYSDVKLMYNRSMMHAQDVLHIVTLLEESAFLFGSMVDGELMPLLES